MWGSVRKKVNGSVFPQLYHEMFSNLKNKKRFPTSVKIFLFYVFFEMLKIGLLEYDGRWLEF